MDKEVILAPDETLLGEYDFISGVSSPSKNAVSVKEGLKVTSERLIFDNQIGENFDRQEFEIKSIIGIKSSVNVVGRSVGVVGCVFLALFAAVFGIASIALGALPLFSDVLNGILTSNALKIVAPCACAAVSIVFMVWAIARRPRRSYKTVSLELLSDKQFNQVNSVVLTEREDLFAKLKGKSPTLVFEISKINEQTFKMLNELGGLIALAKRGNSASLREEKRAVEYKKSAADIGAFFSKP